MCEECSSAYKSHGFEREVKRVRTQNFKSNNSTNPTNQYKPSLKKDTPACTLISLSVQIEVPSPLPLRIKTLNYNPH
jgi:hypothetical protein